MNILLLGSGGREHAMACQLAASPKCTHLYIAPGNAGTAGMANHYGQTVVQNVAIDPTDFPSIHTFVIREEISMVVVGPEAPLVAGIKDYFASNPALRKVMVIGPSKECAQLEGSKDYAKAFMQRQNIPTAAYRTFTTDTLQDGIAFLETLNAPYVLKADGLAAGKGVLILPTLEEAKQELTSMLRDAKFGEASSKVVIEEFLKGIELSVFVLCDGKHYKILPTAKDYKRIGEGDTGLNTGGMGSISPVFFADKQFMQKVEERIVSPTVKGLYKEGTPYKGFIFVGLMAVTDPTTGELDPYVREHVWRGNLQQTTLEIDPRSAACVMAVAEGYPGHYEKGQPIDVISQINGSIVYHAGTRLDDQGKLVTNGGRVLCVTSLADSMPQALLKSYQELSKISWKGMYYRHDIGQDLLKLIVGQ